MGSITSNKILITGAAGFIGFHLSSRFIAEGFQVIGIDNINNYYDVNLKFSRLNELGIEKNLLNQKKIASSTIYDNYRFVKADIADHDFIVKFMIKEKFDYVVNLAAQAGVRYSIDNPRAYTHSNIDGFLSLLEGSRHSNVKHLIYASTSSVYGLNSKMPLSENDTTDHPMAIYAATKKANELMAHSYSHLFNLPTTGLRFFTVYGPWGRPDMALFLFTHAISNNTPINVFNKGEMVRDFTYVDDITESIRRLIFKPPKTNLEWDAFKTKGASSSAPYQIFNIGNSSPVKLMDYINAIEKALGRKAKINMIEKQPGDVLETHAETKSLEKYIRFKPNTPIEFGVNRFVDWYRENFTKI